MNEQGEFEPWARELASRAAQQPHWEDLELAGWVRAALAVAPALVEPDEIDALRGRLAQAALGRAVVLQVGDCAEDPAHRTPEHLKPKAALLDELAAAMGAGTGLPVIRVGRIAGQYAKPRSASTENVDGQALHSFRGLMINGPENDPSARVHDARRMEECHEAAAAVLAYLREWASADRSCDAARIWTSHEALVLDYELPQVRRFGDRLLLTSTHWPWIGERTRQLDGAHVPLLAAVENPVACKVGPDLTEEQLLDLCRRLDPDRIPGRLTLIVRFGAHHVAQRLPRLVAAVGEAGHPLLWLCDPMHANTIRTSSGLKTRLLPDVLQEITGFCEAVASAGGIPGGLHLEASADPIRECLWDPAGLEKLDGTGYTTLCDPRLDTDQAIAAVRCWAAVRGTR